MTVVLKFQIIYNIKHIGLALMPPTIVKKSFSRLQAMRCFLIRSTTKSAVGSPSSWRNWTAVSTAWQPQSVPLFWRCVCKYIEYFIHCETAVDLAQLIRYSRRQLPVKEAIRNFYPIAQSRLCYTHWLVCYYVRDTSYPINNCKF